MMVSVNDPTNSYCEANFRPAWTQDDGKKSSVAYLMKVMELTRKM